MFSGSVNEDLKLLQPFTNITSPLAINIGLSGTYGLGGHRVGVISVKN